MTYNYNEMIWFFYTCIFQEFTTDKYDPKTFTAGNSFEVIDDVQDIPEFNDFDNLEKYSSSAPDAPKPKPDENKKDEINLDLDPELTVSSKVVSMLIGQVKPTQQQQKYYHEHQQQQHQHQQQQQQQ